MPWLTPDAHQEKVEAARDIVLRRLDHSPASRGILADLLRRKEVEPEIAQEVLDRLEKVGLIDDAAYASMLARTRFAEKGAARRAIAEELRRKGVSGEAMRVALDQIGEDDEYQAAERLAMKKLRSLQRVEEVVRRRRTLAFLGRKGYGAGVAGRAYSAARAALEAEGFFEESDSEAACGIESDLDFGAGNF